MLAQWQYSDYRELPIVGDLIDEDMILEILEIFIKELNVVTARWDPKPCH